MNYQIKKKLQEALYTLITDAKKEKFDRIANLRTRHLTVAVENIYQEHNASAVMRTCDCFGIQDLHIIEQTNKFTVQREIAMGAGQWVNHYHYTDEKFPTSKCIRKLKEDGYKIIATTPHAQDQSIHELDVSQPIALLFGTEKKGLSEAALQQADEYVRIPMYGFTESFNISVSAALCLQILRHKLEKYSENINWLLSAEEIIDLKIQWCKKIINNADVVEKELTQRIVNNTYQP